MVTTDPPSVPPEKYATPTPPGDKELLILNYFRSLIFNNARLRTKQQPTWKYQPSSPKKDTACCEVLKHLAWPELL